MKSEELEGNIRCYMSSLSPVNLSEMSLRHTCYVCSCVTVKVMLVILNHLTISFYNMLLHSEVKEYLSSSLAKLTYSLNESRLN